MNRRRLQLASTIERTVQQVLARGLHDPRVKGLITVTGVDLNDATRTATVRVSILPEEHESLTMHGLRAATTHIRKDVMGRIRTREMPRLEFQLDRTVKEQAALLNAINRAVEDTPPAPTDDAPLGRDPTPEAPNDAASASPEAASTIDRPEPSP